MIFHNLPTAAESLGRRATKPHCHKIALYVFGPYAVYKDVTQQALKVSTNLILRVESTIFCIHLASAVERWVCRHETIAHEPAAEYA